MGILQAASHFLKYLPLVGLAAFYFDSSFLNIQIFLPVADYPSLGTIYIIASIACIIAAVGLLYIVHRNLETKLRILNSVGILNRSVVLSQSAIICIIIFTLFQYYEKGTYYVTNISILLIISYSVALFFMGLLAVKFFSWYNYDREILVLGYAVAICVLILFLIVSIAYASYELSRVYDEPAKSVGIGEQITFRSFSPNIYSMHYYFVYIGTFVSVWVITTLFLISHLSKKRILLFYFVFAIPLLYFLIPSIPQFSSYINSFVVNSPSLYGSLYGIFFSGTGPIGGLVSSIALLVLAKNVKDHHTKRYLLISAFGMLLFFTINKDPPLAQLVSPPFGVVSQSFIGLSCYMIFLGFYTTVIYLSRKDVVIHTVLKQMSKDKFFGSLVRSQQERQLTEIIRKSMDSLEREKQIESKSLSLDEIEKAIRTVRQEMTSLREKEKS